MGLNFYIVLIVVHRGHLWFSAAVVNIRRPHVIFWRHGFDVFQLPLWYFDGRCTLQRPLVIFRRTLMMILVWINLFVASHSTQWSSSFSPVWCKCLTTSIQSQPRVIGSSLSSPLLSHILLWFFVICSFHLHTFPWPSSSSSSSLIFFHLVVQQLDDLRLWQSESNFLWRTRIANRSSTYQEKFSASSFIDWQCVFASGTGGCWRIDPNWCLAFHLDRLLANWFPGHNFWTPSSLCISVLVLMLCWAHTNIGFISLINRFQDF